MKRVGLSYKKTVLLVFTVAFFLRLYQLGYRDFWYDEMGTISNIMSHYYSNQTPFYSMLMQAWNKLFGISEFSLRLPSLIFSFLSVILVFILGLRLFNKNVSMLAACVMGLSPFHIWYAQEARSYSMLLFFGLLSNCLLFEALKEEDKKLWAVFILVSVLGLYTNYCHLILLVTQFLYVLYSKKLRISLMHIIGFLVIILGFSFLLPSFFKKFFFVWGGFWIPRPSWWKSPIYTLGQFMLGYNAPKQLYILSIILLGVFFTSLFLNIKERTKNTIFCMFMLFVPMFLTLAFSLLLFPIYLSRVLIMASPFLYLIAAKGALSLDRLAKKHLLSMIFLALFIAIYGYFNDWMPKKYLGINLKKPIRPVARFIDERFGAQDILAFTDVSVMPSFKFYSIRKMNTYYLFDPEFPGQIHQRPISKGRFLIPLDEINMLNAKRIWVIYSNWDRDGKLYDSSRSIKEYLDENFAVEESEEFDGLQVVVYTKKP